MKHAISQFMYLPITKTLEEGFRSLGAAEVTLTSGHGPARRAALLNAGDIIVWVGAGRWADMLPLRPLGARGIRRILYSTEPMPDRCILAAATRTNDFWDEMWHYTMHNVRLCVAERETSHGLVHRYIPPGAFVSSTSAFTLRASAAAGVHGPLSSKAVFLGIIPRNSTPAMPGFSRRACYRTLSRELGDKLTHRENVFALSDMRRLLKSHGVFVNLHKDCGLPDRPAEAVRFSLLLSAGATIISERADPADERMFAGLVKFVPLQQLAGAVTSALTERETESEGAVTRRMEDFKQRFGPVSLFARAGLANGSTSIGFTDKNMACRYEPGSIEREWLHSTAFGSICAIARRTSQLSALQKSLAFARSSWSTTARLPTTEEQPVMSQLVCESGTRIEYLEPLTGIALPTAARQASSTAVHAAVRFAVLTMSAARKRSRFPHRFRTLHAALPCHVPCTLQDPTCTRPVPVT